VLAIAARALQALGQKLLASEGTRRTALIALLPAVLIIDWGLGLDRSKPHMLACIEWMRGNIPRGTHLFTNDKQLAAASGLHWEWEEVRDVNRVFAEARAPFEPGTVWAMRLREGQSGLAAALARESHRLAPITQFTGENGDRIVILRPRPPASLPAPTPATP